MSPRSRLVARLLVAGALLSAAGCTERAVERTAAGDVVDRASQASFGTPDSATAALESALERHDRAELQRLLGPGTDSLLSSGDTALDARDREAFVTRYREGHQLVAGGPDDLVLQVGADHWPLPIPLVRRDARWYFDGDAATHELRMRRIGANELRTIDVLRGFVAAQEEYAATGRDGGLPGVYARAVRSAPGRHDGLYWAAGPGEPPSPAGPLLAAAVEEHGAAEASARTPYHGYVYRMLLAQGPAADGGARDYVVDGRLTGGFALLARPERYGETGVMTFMVNQDGVVWQRDLGDSTTARAAAIQRFDPDGAWTPIAQEEERSP